MRTEKNILIAFLLNLCFSIFELFGGLFTHSIAIISDAVHDLGDAISIGLSYFLEKKSKKQPDKEYSYGYLRYSVLGAFITNLILVIGSIFVVYNAVLRIINPVDINHNGMIIFAIIGAAVNFLAAYVTREGDSLNQKAVNLHMIEDVLGWIVVLVGALVIKFTNFVIIDPLMSIGVAIFILSHAVSGLKEILYLFLEKTPEGININDIRDELLIIKGVIDVHHIHVWSIDGYHSYATMHAVLDGNHMELKQKIRNKLKSFNIEHVTIETELKGEVCHDKTCHVCVDHSNHGHHHHHHGHSHGHNHAHNHNHEYAQNNLKKIRYKGHDSCSCGHCGHDH